MALIRAAGRAELVAAGLVLVSLVLLALPEPQKNAITTRANRWILFPVVRVEGVLGGYLGLREENERLRTALQRARLEAARSETARVENRRLSRMLDFASTQPVRLVAARVVDRDFATVPTMFVLDAGSRAGVVPSAPVVTVEGLVGKTVEVGPSASRVMLYTHPEFSASALLLGGDHLDFGIVRSTPRGGLELYLPLRSASERGDRIVTSGYGGAFPRGIPIGEVVEVREDRRLGLQKIDRVEPVVDLGRTTAVFVVTRDTLEAVASDHGPRLFWPGFAYPPMAGETMGEGEDVPEAATEEADSARGTRR